MAVDVSVVISTYNRCTVLARALQALLCQQANEMSYEILVIDNNSSDQTRDLVQALITKDPEKLRYIFEPQQGLSYARNTGIANARAPIIAFTDDDVCVASDWIALGFVFPHNLRRADGCDSFGRCYVIGVT